MVKKGAAGKILSTLCGKNIATYLRYLVWGGEKVKFKQMHPLPLWERGGVGGKSQ